MSEKEDYSRSMIPKGIAIVLSLLLVPLAMGGMYYAAFSLDEDAANYGPSEQYGWLSIFLPGLLLNGLLAFASRPRKEKALVIPWFLLLLAVTAVGGFLYLLIMLLTHKGDLKIGG
jgi:hypothetical protein